MGWFEERFVPDQSRHQFDCVVCGKPMWFPKCKHGKYITCGKACSTAKHASEKEARKKNCATCGKEFYPRATQTRNGKGNYCSQKCNIKSHVAMNSKTAQKIARESWRKRYDEQPFFKSGPKHHSWKGGYEAMRARLVSSGKTRIWYWNRVNKNGAKRADPRVVKELGDMQKWKCAICKEKLVKYDIDHIQPVSKGGTNEKHNLQLLCQRCNRTKQAKDPIEFMQSKGFLL